MAFLESSMSKVFKVPDGRKWHIVHEERTGYANTYALCDSVASISGSKAQVQHREADCDACRRLDNPFTMSATDRHLLGRIYRGEYAAYDRALYERDLLTAQGHATAKGLVLLNDFAKGPAPAVYDDNVVHKRFPLTRVVRCNNSEFPYMERMSLSQYAALRNLNLVVTCIRCLTIPHGPLDG